MFSEEVKKVCNHFKDKNKLGLRHHKFYNQIKSETDFLPEEAIIGQRFWHVLNNIKDIPKCLECKTKEVKWDYNFKKYNSFCSQKCSNNNINIRKQISNNNKKSWQNKSKEEKEKFGKKVSISQQNRSEEEKEKIQKKRKQTNLEKYGVDNPMRSKRFQDKFSKSYQNKSKEEKEGIIRKRKQSFQNRSEKEKEKSLKKYKQTNLNKYGVEYVTQLKKFQDKTKQTNLDKYGVENTKQKHLSKDTLDKLKDPDYLKDQHHNKKKTLTEIAKEFGCSSFPLHQNFHKYNIPILTHSSSTKEKEVSSYIKNIYKKDFPTNTRKVITPLELDIYLEDLKLAVEFNGTYWHSDFKKDKEYHFNKVVECYKKKVKLINIYEYEWENDKEEIKYWLKKYITNNLDDIITKNIYLEDITDKKEIILSLNWPINYKLLKQNNFKFKETLEPKVVKINNFDIYDAGKIIFKKI